MKTGLCAAVFVSILACASLSFAGVLKERAYQTHWCGRENGVAEYRLPDKTRVDCVTAEYAVEVDFAGKWAEAIGQAVYYAMMTEKKPGILLIMEEERDARYLKRLKAVTDGLGIAVWTITPDDVRQGK